MTYDDLLAELHRVAETAGATTREETVEAVGLHVAGLLGMELDLYGDGQCSVSSWRAKGADYPFGPGGFNRCIKPDHPRRETHVDGFEQAFLIEPKFRVLGRVRANG